MSQNIQSRSLRNSLSFAEDNKTSSRSSTPNSSLLPPNCIGCFTMNKLKLMTIIGTRPEIIRLSAVIKKCDVYFDQILVHTGQNYDYNLNQVFFEDLGLRAPDF